MATLSVSETTTFRWTFEQDVENYRSAGVSAMGVWRQKVSDCGLTRAADLMRSFDVKASHLAWAGGFTGSDGRNFRESVDDALEALHAASILGAATLVVYSGARAGHTYNHARRLLREALKELLPVAVQLNVSLALEPMHPCCAADWTFLTSVDDALEVIHAVGGERLKLVIDTFHLGFVDNFASRVREITPFTALVQLGDSRLAPCGEQNRCFLGEGAVPLREIIDAFRDAGYDGYYDVELLGEEFESVEYREILRRAKLAFEEYVSPS